ncbi:AraC family transcriptional regulator [Paenibacillus sp. NPDC058071]|uniref:AraC family transcriptional regulator n=1 Tax=Paenibacillus sp. NPDC058071 TaxID=3346326 RepID=UPI0036D80B9A
MQLAAFQRVYFRIFMLFLAIFILVFLPFIFLITTQFSRYAVEEMDRNAHNKVTDIRDNMEYVLEKLKGYAISMYEDQNIQNWLLGDRSDELLAVAAMKTQNNFMYNEPFISRTYIINSLTHSVIDSQLGRSSFDDFEDQPILDKVMLNDEMYLSFFNHIVDDTEYLAMIVPASPNKKDYGHLVLLIDKPKVTNYLFGPIREQSTDISVFNTDGQRIFGSASIELDAAIDQRFRSNRDNKIEMKFQGDRYYINRTVSDMYEWNVYYANNYGYITQRIQDFKEKLLIFSFISLGLIAILFFVSSRRSLGSFSQLAEKIRERYDTDLNDNNRRITSILASSEMKLIDRGLEAIFANVEQLNSSVRDHRELVRSEHLSQWIFQGNLNQKSRHYLSQETRLLKESYLYLSVIRIDSYLAFCDQYDFNSRKLLKYAIRNISEEVLHQRGIAAESLDLGSDHLVLLIGSEEQDIGALLPLLDNIREYISANIKIEVSIAVSNANSSQNDLRILYQHIYELTMLKFLSGENHIFMENEYEEFVQSLPATELSSQELIQLIQNGQAEQAIDKLRQQMKVLAGCSYEDCKLNIIHLIYELTKAFNKRDAIKEFNGIHKVLDRFSTLAQLQGWLEDVIRKIIAEITIPKAKTRQEKVVHEIHEYVHMHLQDPQLSVERVAEHLSFSISYLRQVHREVTGMTMSDYILNEKITLVKKLLASTDLTMYEIMERSGFLTKSHFFAAFKKMTGLTPKQYRESQLSDNGDLKQA